MNHSAKLSALAVLTASFFASTSVLAQDASAAHPPIKPPVVHLTHVPPAAVKHLGQGVYINAGNKATTVAGGGFTPVDTALTITCPGASGTCLFQADQFMQVGQGSTSGNQFALCFYVDGVSVNGCFFNGSAPSDGSYVMGGVSQGITVSHGNHTVQTYIYNGGGTYLSSYNFTYRIYKP